MKEPTYLRVDATFKTDGTVVPTMLYWTDNTPFIIDKVMDIRPGASLKHGGSGLQYTVRIQGKERVMFLVQNRWFIEEKGTA